MMRCARPWLLVLLFAWALLAAMVPLRGHAQDDELGDIAQESPDDLLDEEPSDLEDDAQVEDDTRLEDEAPNDFAENEPPAQAPVDDMGDEEEAASPNEPNAWSLRLSAELGIGMREFALPENNAVFRTETGVFPAAGAGFELDHALSEGFVLGLLLRYQTSVGHGLVEQHTGGSEHPIDVRAHHLELALAPTVYFDAAAHWGLCFSIGYGIAGFRPIAHLVTPGFSLAGPHLRVQLQAPLVPDVLRLRIGPEGQWIAHVGDELIERGVDSSGVAVGGEAALELSIAARWAIHATYREMRSFLGTSQAESFEDMARFVTARLVGTL